MTKNLRNYSVDRLECLPNFLSFQMEGKGVTVRSKGWRDYPAIHGIVWSTVKQVFKGSLGKHYNVILNNLKARWKDSWNYASTPEDAIGWQADRIINTSLGRAVISGNGRVFNLLKSGEGPRRYWKKAYYFDENNILCETEGQIRKYRIRKTKQVLLAERRALKAEKKAKEEWALALIATINKPDLLDYALHPRNRNRNQ